MLVMNIPNLPSLGFSLSATAPKTREQAIENYRLLLKKKRDLTRRKGVLQVLYCTILYCTVLYCTVLQTKIASYARKHQLDLTGNVDLGDTTPAHDAQLYSDLLDKLKTITYDRVEHTKMFTYNKYILHFNLIR